MGYRNPKNAGGVDNKHCGMADAVAVCGCYWNLESRGTGLGKEAAGDVAGGHRGPPGVRGQRSEVTGRNRQQRRGDEGWRAPAVTRREDLGRSLPAGGRRPPRRMPATAAAIAFGRTDGSRVRRKELRIVGCLGPEAVGGPRLLEQYCACAASPPSSPPLASVS